MDGTYPYPLQLMYVPPPARKRGLRPTVNIIFYRQITSAVTCASCVDTKQQLTGELGGGLICRNGKDATWAFNGALSWGFRDRSNAPSAVFSNVHQVLDWVQKTMTSN